MASSVNVYAIYQIRYWHNKLTLFRQFISEVESSSTIKWLKLILYTNMVHLIEK